MGITLPEGIKYGNTSLRVLQAGIDQIYTEVHDKLDELGIDDPEVIRNSELLTLSYLLGKYLPSSYREKEIAINHFTALSSEGEDFEPDKIDEIKHSLEIRSGGGISFDDEKIEVRNIDDRKLFKKIILHRVLNKYYNPESN